MPENEVAEQGRREAETGRVGAEKGRVAHDEDRVNVLRDLIDAQKTLGERVSDLTSEVRKFAHRNWRLLVAVFVLVVILASVSLSNRQILNLVKSVTDPSGERYREGQEQTAKILSSLAIEQDCRLRRQHAGLPAPIPATKLGDPNCTSQTPSDVYPGLDPSTPREDQPAITGGNT